MSLRLYELPAAIREIETRIIEAEGELTPEDEQALDALEGEFNHKAEWIALLAQEARAEAAGSEQQAKRLAARVRSAKNREGRLKSYLHDCMTARGVSKVEGEQIKISVVKNSQPTITWTGDPESIPEGYKRVTIAPDLAHAREQMKAGEMLPDGFTVERGSHVRCR